MEQKRVAEYKETGELTTILVLFANTFKDAGIGDVALILSEIEAINRMVDEFNVRCWPEIKVLNDSESVFRSFKFETDSVVLLTMVVAGRILMTFRPTNSKIDKFVSIVGAEDITDYSSCGLQGICATKDEALFLLNDIVQNWDREKYTVNYDADYSIL